MTYARKVIIDFQVVNDGGQVRGPQRQIWIDRRRKLDLALTPFNDEQYTVAEFLLCTRHVTPKFGVLRPAFQLQVNIQNPFPVVELPLPEHRQERTAQNRKINHFNYLFEVYKEILVTNFNLFQNFH